MGDRPLFAGQVERLEFDLEQIRAIASPARSEIFWAYSATDPFSVQDIAMSRSRSVGTVHYHTNELVRVGLLIQAGTQKRGAREGRLYVRKGRRSIAVWFPRPHEYRIAADKGFNAIMRAIGRERATFHEVHPHARWIGGMALFNLSSLRLSEEDFRKMKDELREVVERYEQNPDPHGIRIRFAAVAHPEMGELREAFRKSTGKRLRSEPDPHESDES